MVWSQGQQRPPLGMVWSQRQWCSYCNLAYESNGFVFAVLCSVGCWCWP